MEEEKVSWEKMMDLKVVVIARPMSTAIRRWGWLSYTWFSITTVVYSLVGGYGKYIAYPGAREKNRSWVCECIR